MATVTGTLTTYTNATLTYAASTSDTATTISASNVTYTNSRSNGFTEKVILYGDVYINGADVGFPTKTASKGAKSTSIAFSGSQTIARTHAAQSIPVKLDAHMDTYSGDTWGTKSGGLAYVTVPAKASYSVAYNANGGKGSVLGQTKWYGESLTLADSGFSKDDFKLVKWNTMADGSGTDYALGAAYTANAPLTLYAIWERIYDAPSITALTVARTDKAGNLSDTGAYVKVTASWQVYNTYKSQGSGNANGATLATKVTLKNAASPTKTYTQTLSLASNNTTSEWLTGTASFVMGSDVNSGMALSSDQAYTVDLTLTDTKGKADRASTRSGEVGAMKLLLDFHTGGAGASFGSAATGPGLNVSMAMRCYETAMMPVLKYANVSTPPTESEVPASAKPCLVMMVQTGQLWLYT